MHEAALKLVGGVTASETANSREAVSLLPAEVTDLVYKAGGRTLIDGLNLKLGPNGITVIIGPNGAGKSLLLRLLHGLIVPDRGSIIWNGQSMNRDVQARQALVFQKPVLLRRSVGENIDFVLRLKGKASSGRRDELLSRVGLLDLAKQPARLLSGGEQQRLSLARALATEPEVMFLDEPTANLDPASVQSIEAIVSAASSNGVRLIFVTHDLGQAKRLADDVVFMHRGRVAEHSLSSPFFETPASEVARDFLAGRIVL